MAKTMLQALWHGQDNSAGSLAWPIHFCRVSGMANTILQGEYKEHEGEECSYVCYQGRLSKK